MDLKIGDRIMYQGDRRFHLPGGKTHKQVKPGDIGVVVSEEKLLLWDEKPGWKVDFGEGKVVTLSKYDFGTGAYRKEV
jgi:hypothetical protein